MVVRAPTIQELEKVAASVGLKMSHEELKEHLDILSANFQAYDLIDRLPDNLPRVVIPRDGGRRVEASENPLGAWYWKTSIKSGDDGPLSGRQVVLKDNINLADVPMMNGASTLEGYVPDFDATVVGRVLRAGGEIVGKAHCEYFCLSGASHTNAKGPVHNPHKRDFSSGGSSSGCGALVASGEVDLAIGCDQGGSIRLPAAWSGCVGMKPTWGLVPYTGIVPIEATIDHAGPITGTVEDNALLLQVLAGADGLDPRQNHTKPDNYSAKLGQDIRGLKIGLVVEGFNRPDSEKSVDEAVRGATEALAKVGAEVAEISIPWHNYAHSIWLGIALEGLTEQMLLRNGAGLNWRGLYSTSFIDFHANWRQRADEFSDSLKSCLLTGQYMLERYHGRYYAKAQNLSRRLRDEYDAALSRVDVLVMPTTPMRATPLPTRDAPRSEYVARAFEMIGNTAPFNATGHPAISVPCGFHDGLPIGLQIIGKHHDEVTLYKVAYAHQCASDWRRIGKDEKK